MSVKKIIIDRFYKRNYVQVEDGIYEVEYARQIKDSLIKRTNEPEVLEAVLKNPSSINYPATNLKTVKYKTFPDNEKMVQTLLNKRAEIYDKLNLSAINHKNKQLIQGMLILDYLAKHGQYNMMGNEDINVDEAFNKKLAIMQKQYAKLEQTIEQKILKAQNMQSSGLKEYKAAVKQAGALVQKQKEMVQDFEELGMYQANRLYLKSLYNKLIYKKGVCVEDSFVQQFLLQGIGLATYYAEMKNTKTGIGHAFNIIGIKDSNKVKYYIVDPTLAKDFVRMQRQDLTITAFGLSSEEYFTQHQNKQIFSLKTTKDLLCHKKEDLLCENFSKKRLENILSKLQDKKSLLEVRAYAKKMIENGYNAPKVQEK